MDDKKTPGDSPWQDAKDFKGAVNTAAKKLDDFTTHSTSRVLGPLATKSLNGIKRWWSTPRPLPAKRNAPKPSFLSSVFGWFSGAQGPNSTSATDDLPTLSPVDNPSGDDSDWT